MVLPLGVVVVRSDRCWSIGRDVKAALRQVGICRTITTVANKCSKARRRAAGVSSAQRLITEASTPRPCTGYLRHRRVVPGLARTRSRKPHAVGCAYPATARSLCIGADSTHLVPEWPRLMEGSQANGGEEACRGHRHGCARRPCR